MKSFFAAIAFLTRLPAGKLATFDAADVAHSSGWFPLIGLLLGAIYAFATVLLRTHLPPGVIAVLLIVLDALLTGALHFDGLADTADGFGGGKSREEVLRIMRDHAIGSYGGLALATLVVMKTTAYTGLLQQNNWLPAVILAPAMGRWSMLLLTATLPYARQSASVIEGMGKRALFWGTVPVVVALLVAQSVRGWVAWAVTTILTGAFGIYCRRRIAGITGDTLGANLQLCESAALLSFLWIRSPQ